ncbi:hypothetical protein N657DRAFT_112490 [Parathielavia appendiculata]|uniref:Uncharacterized protein n=1 Tax=Parathielavia appendiculata TaxID=2587402 RepID=A0AAN6TVQ7_9PEZI|nr:hypothetical protein N657DRAFT_112490 [Parathielavia appendiculata]
MEADSPCHGSEPHQPPQPHISRLHLTWGLIRIYRDHITVFILSRRRPTDTVWAHPRERGTERVPRYRQLCLAEQSTANKSVIGARPWSRHETRTPMSWVDVAETSVVPDNNNCYPWFSKDSSVRWKKIDGSQTVVSSPAFKCAMNSSKERSRLFWFGGGVVWEGDHKPISAGAESPNFSDERSRPSQSQTGRASQHSPHEVIFLGWLPGIAQDKDRGFFGLVPTSDL